MLRRTSAFLKQAEQRIKQRHRAQFSGAGHAACAAIMIDYLIRELWAEAVAALEPAVLRQSLNVSVVAHGGYRRVMSPAVMGPHVPVSWKQQPGLKVYRLSHQRRGLFFDLS